MLKYLVSLCFAFIASNSNAAQVYYDDTDGDGQRDEITVTDQMVKIFHPATGLSSEYGMGLVPYTFFKTVDTDGKPGAEVVLKQDSYAVVINDVRRTRVGYSIGSEGVLRDTGQTNGRMGQEVLGFNNAGLFVIVDAEGRVANYNLQPDQPAYNPYLTTTLHRIADTSGDGGDEVVLSRNDNKAVIVNDTVGQVSVRDLTSGIQAPGTVTTTTLYEVADVDGIAGGEIIGWRNDNSVVVVHEHNNGVLSTYAIPSLFTFAGIADTDSDGVPDIVLSRNDFIISVLADRTRRIRNYNIGQAFSVSDLGNYDGVVGADICYKTVLSNPIYTYALIDRTSQRILVQNCDAQNLTPQASAGPDISSAPGTEVVLSAMGSTDADGRITKYNWKQKNGPELSLNGVSVVNVKFVTPAVAEATSLEFEVTITDNKGATNSDSVIVTVVPTIPGAPSHINVPANSDNLGRYTVSWGSAPGSVTRYELYEAKQAGASSCTKSGCTWPPVSFANEVLRYSGTELYVALSIMNSTNNGLYYYRVRACNSAGCSGYRTSENGVNASSILR